MIRIAESASCVNCNLSSVFLHIVIRILADQVPKQTEILVKTPNKAIF